MLLEDPGQSSTPVHAETPHSGGALRIVVIVVAVIYVAVSLYLMFDMRSRLEKAEARIAATDIKAEETADALKSTRANVKENFQALGQKVGMTSEELARRSAELNRTQAEAAKLARAQQEQGQQISKVSGDVSTVRGDLGSAKTDIASTRTDLDETKKKLESTIGDLNVQSGLIAHTRDDLETLKHRGDRNIFEFTLSKNHRQPVSTVSLELKKADRKKGKFTLNVLADDRTIEKKDRTLFEPMQFYTGRDKMLYEVVIMTVDKDKISGYLSAPKGAPVPVSK
jgi:multidrug efflux pump subunit AcrA (membrane-fusion protein)